MFFFYRLFNKMSSVEINEDGQQKKLPFDLWDK